MMAEVRAIVQRGIDLLRQTVTDDMYWIANVELRFAALSVEKAFDIKP